MRLTRRSFLLGAVSLPVVAGLPAGEAEAALAPEIDLMDVIMEIRPSDTPLWSHAMLKADGPHHYHDWVMDDLRPYENAPPAEAL